MELYIGLMSGTSVDGIDAVLVDFSSSTPSLLATHYVAYSADLRHRILALCEPGENEIKRLGELDHLLGKAFAGATNDLLASQSLSTDDVQAIGSHGQTIRHYPELKYTLQIGDPNVIAAETRITTIADFRRKDIAFGGQGAPLVPAFHHHLFASDKINRAIVNIGGIANVTHLSPQIIGFDTGPGNLLLDAWIQKHQAVSQDQNGDWARLGAIHSTLLNRLLADPYFQLPPPKSTGREYFNLSWLHQFLDEAISAVDVQATLVELSARSIINAIPLSTDEILICGGGAHNGFLMQRLQALSPIPVHSTQHYGVDPDWVEAIAFAWLARQTLHKKPGNLPSVTGAREAIVLGGIYYGQ